MPEPAIVKHLTREIDAVTSKLTELGLSDDQNCPATSTGSGSNWDISVHGAKLNLALKKRPYADIYAELLESRSFNLVLLDGALLQFAYSGQNEEVERHRLAYLPSPSLEPFQNNPELYFNEVLFAEIVGYQVVPVPMRLDFDARAGIAIDLVHPVAHLTLGQYSHCRIPITSPATPVQFAEFIVRSFYSTPNMDPIAFPKQSHRFSESITASERERMHLVVS